MTDLVYTIGHSTHPAEKLIHLLVGHAVTAVADVRSQPYSRFNPQFNRENLPTDLKVAGISYVFLGRELGARPENRSCYVQGKIQYDLLARTVLFQEGLTRVAQGISNHRVALLCAEKDPLTCHRAILVCRHLAEIGITERDLFRSRDELVVEAYSRRGDQIAYAETEPSSSGLVRGRQQ